MKTPLFDHVALIGVGLIGGSLALALRHHGLAAKISGCSRHQKTRDQIRALGLVDHLFSDPAAAVADADLVVLCTPVGSFAAIAAAIGPHLGPGVVVTDVGSVKRQVIRDLRAHLGENIAIVPSHPIAGTEHSGPGAARKDLFAKRWCIVTPDTTSSESIPSDKMGADTMGADRAAAATDRVCALWRAIGMKVRRMPAKDHDRILAITSHLPHLIAYTIVGTAVDMEDSHKGEVIDFAAGGFRDFTRIASSDPDMWRDIFLANKDVVVDVCRQFQGDLEHAVTAVDKGDMDALLTLFNRGRRIRKAIIRAGQHE